MSITLRLHCAIANVHKQLALLLQLYQIAKANLKGRTAPVTTLCTFASCCRCLWIVQFKWEHEERPDSSPSSGKTDSSSQSDDPQWRLASCNVAPAFSASAAVGPGAPLAAQLRLEEYSDTGSIDMRQFMVWANKESCAPPAGFEILVRYVETLALQHGLPLAQLDFCQLDGTSLVSSSDAQVIAHGCCCGSDTAERR